VAPKPLALIDVSKSVLDAARACARRDRPPRRSGDRLRRHPLDDCCRARIVGAGADDDDTDLSGLPSGELRFAAAVFLVTDGWQTRGRRSA
jgi:hypothetical protein